MDKYPESMTVRDNVSTSIVREFNVGSSNIGIGKGNETGHNLIMDKCLERMSVRDNVNTHVFS